VKTIGFGNGTLRIGMLANSVTISEGHEPVRIGALSPGQQWEVGHPETMLVFNNAESLDVFLNALKKARDHFDTPPELFLAS
jgi:hypothetical protein